RRDEGRPRRVLRRDRRRNSRAPARSALHAQAVPVRYWRAAVLPQAGAEGQAAVDPDAPVPHVATRRRVPARRFHPRERARRAAAYRPPCDVQADLRVRRAALPAARGFASRARYDRVAEEEASRRPRRPPPERTREDDRLGLFRAAEAGRAGLDAAALGGADREGAAARLRPPRGARPGSEARRPVRAGAAGRAGSRARSPTAACLGLGGV